MATTPTSSPIQSRLLSTSQAAHVILGGTRTERYWGFTFQSFVDQLQAQMAKNLGRPEAAHWRGLLDFTPEDYRELDQVIEQLDQVRNPAHHLDPAAALAFAKRCDVIGMHGGIHGIGVGKDTAADALKPYGFVSMAFADGLKASASLAYGIPMRYFTERSLKQEPLPGGQLSPRRVMQLWGTEIIRGIRDDIWLKRHLLQVASASLNLPAIGKSAPERLSAAGGIRVCIPDVRYPNEGAYVHELGGFTAWISRPSLAAVGASLSHGHSSEAGIPPHPSDVHLVNDGSKADFQAKAVTALLARFDATGSRPRRPRP